MRAPPKYGPRQPAKCAWICPVTRLRKELGMDYFWTARGPVIDGGMLKEPIVGIEINGLPYCTWEQFQGIRWALQQSHQMGRHQAVLYCGIHGDEVAALNDEKEWPIPSTNQVRHNNRGNRKMPPVRRSRSNMSRL